MIAFWVVAGVLSAACAGVILSSSARAATRAGAADPTTALYRRQLREIDDLADRGLIPEAERNITHAEAARRLLASAEGHGQAWSADTAVRKPILALAALTPLLALAAYVAVGSPGLPDQPFKSRVAAWRGADPASLTPPEMAVVLQSLIKERGGDVEAYGYLAQAEMASDNPAGAARALRRAIELDPKRADLWEGLGEVLLVEAQGEVTPPAVRAFEEALKLYPASVNARFHLARARIAAGGQEEGLAAWRALAADLPAADPRRAAVQSAIAQAEDQPAPAAAGLGEQMGAVQGMVASLAARLEADPDDKDGWVRLVRSYAVLGDEANRDAALAKARTRYAADPDVLKALDLAAKTESMR
jgi:cytochrome c-type biogenesis protein CcmH